MASSSSISVRSKRIRKADRPRLGPYKITEKSISPQSELEKEEEDTLMNDPLTKIIETYDK